MCVLAVYDYFSSSRSFFEVWVKTYRIITKWSISHLPVYPRIWITAHFGKELFIKHIQAPFTAWCVFCHVFHFRAPEVYLCYRRGRDRPPLMDIGVFYGGGREKVLADSQIVEFTPSGHVANVNNTNTSTTFLTYRYSVTWFYKNSPLHIVVVYRRATDVSPCNELVVMDICVIVTSKGEQPPHSFMKIDKNLNKVKDWRFRFLW